jgi:hypothetical protein
MITTTTIEEELSIIKQTPFFSENTQNFLIDENHAFNFISVYKINWQIRFLNVLKRINTIITLRDLLNTEFNKILILRNCGTKSIELARQDIVRFMENNFRRFSTKDNYEKFLIRQKKEDFKNSLKEKYPFLNLFENEFKVKFLDIPIVEFYFPYRFNQYLKKIGQPMYLKDILLLDPDEIIKESNLGKQTLKSVVSIIQKGIKKKNTLLDHGSSLKEIDNYLSELTEKELLIANRRWGGVDLESYEDIGIDFQVTRERIRQILQRIIDKAQFRFKYDIPIWEKRLLNLLVKQPEPIIEELLINKDEELHHAPKLCLGLLSELVPEAPVKGFMPKSMDQFVRRRIDSDRTWAKLCDTINNLSTSLGDLTTEKLVSKLSSTGFDVSQQLLCFTIILGQKKYFILKEGNKNFLLQKIGIRDLSYRILKGSREPLTIDELLLAINKYYERGAKHESVNSTLNYLRQDDRILQFDRDKLGVEEHFSYPKKEWNKICTTAKIFLRKMVRQCYITEILAELNVSYPLLKSKYELVHILRSDDEIYDLGFFNFVLTSFGRNKRIKLRELITHIFNKDPKVKHFQEIKEELRKSRFVHNAGLPFLLKNQRDLKSYPGGFYGLRSLDEENENEILSKYKFIGFLLNQHFPYTNIDNLIENYDSKFKQQKILATIRESSAFQMCSLENGVTCVVNKNWGVLKTVKCLLANLDEEIYEEQLSWLLKDLGIDNDKRDLYKIRNDRFIHYENNKYILIKSEMLTYNIYPILDQCYDLINDSAKSYSVQELFDLIKTDRNEVMYNHLLAAMQEDERFIVTNTNMVLLK